jgi:hypothetical protein
MIAWNFNRLEERTFSRRSRGSAPDAMILAPWFAPDVEWPEICRLPDFHAVVRVLDDGRLVPPRALRIDRPL